MQRVIKITLGLAFIMFAIFIVRLIRTDKEWELIGHLSAIGILIFDANYKMFSSNQHYKKYLMSRPERMVDYFLYAAIAVFCLVDILSRTVLILSYANTVLTAIAIGTAVLHNKIHTERVNRLDATASRSLGKEMAN